MFSKLFFFTVLYYVHRKKNLYTHCQFLKNFRKLKVKQKYFFKTTTVPLKLLTVTLSFSIHFGKRKNIECNKKQLEAPGSSLTFPASM